MAAFCTPTPTWRRPRLPLPQSGIVIDDQIALSPENISEIVQVETGAKAAPDVAGIAGMVAGRFVTAAFGPFRDQFHQQAHWPNRPNR